MVSNARLIEVVKPVASAILDADAAAIRQIAARKRELAELDRQPAAAAMALERRAMVGTAMRTDIAPTAGWEPIEDNLSAGAYEWRSGDVIVRLSKTTRASRIEEAKALLGVMELFETVADPAGPSDVVLIRLNGSIFGKTTVDVVAVGANGTTKGAIPLKSIAAVELTKLTNAREPEKTKVELPAATRRAVRDSA